MLRSLSTKLILSALLSLMCAAAAYLAVFNIGTLLVNRYYMNPNAVAARKAEAYTDFNRYVQEYRVYSDDTDALQRFLAQRDHVVITVYSAEELNLPGGGAEARTLAMQSYEAPRRSGISGRLYPLRFEDGPLLVHEPADLADYPALSGSGDRRSGRSERPDYGGRRG